MAQNAPRDEKWLLRRIDELEKRIKTLETAPRSGNTSVSFGKFLIIDGETGNEVLRIGYLGPVDGVDVRGTQLTRPTGERILSTWSGGEAPFWAMYDLAGNIIVGDDATSGQGLARPYIGGPLFSRSDTGTWPVATSSSYVTVWWATWVKQHPRLLVSVWTQSASGTSGDIRVNCGGVTQSQAIPSNDSTIRAFSLAVPGDLLSSPDVTVDIRRTSGTGFLGCSPTGAYGVQSD